MWIGNIRERQIEKKTKNKKSKLCFTTCKYRLSVYVGEERLESFMREVPIILVSLRQEPPSWKS